MIKADRNVCRTKGLPHQEIQARNVTSRYFRFLPRASRESVTRISLIDSKR